MNNNGSLQLDVSLAWLAIVINLLVSGVFLARAFHHRRLEKGLGLVMIILALPVALITASNLVAGRPWWLVVLPLLMVIFCAVEFLVDYWPGFRFRQTRWLAPYLVLFYAAMIGMLGYVFAVSRDVGRALAFTALGTYLLSLLATWYSYKKVGHGQG